MSPENLQFFEFRRCHSLPTQTETILGDEGLGWTVTVRVGCQNYQYVHSTYFQSVLHCRLGKVDVSPTQHILRLLFDIEHDMTPCYLTDESIFQR
jgi:hypothetical protein